MLIYQINIQNDQETIGSMYNLEFLFFDEIKIMKYMVNVTTEALASRL